jgi:hypothetical protein
MISPLGNAIRKLVAELGGVSVLAARCEVRESTIMSWILGEVHPTSDELYVLELLARRARVTFPPGPASTRPAPHASGVHAAGRLGEPRRDSGDSRMDELASTFEAYRDWLKRAKTGDGGE